MSYIGDSSLRVIGAYFLVRVVLFSGMMGTSEIGDIVGIGGTYRGRYH